MREYSVHILKYLKTLRHILLENIEGSGELSVRRVGTVYNQSFLMMCKFSAKIVFFEQKIQSLKCKTHTPGK